jgi:hypothetical protein
MNFSVKEIVSSGGAENYVVLDVANESSYCLFNGQNHTVELRNPKNMLFVKRMKWIELDVLVKNGSHRLFKEISIKA